MAITNIKNEVVQNLKNLFGWKTNRKVVVFSIDDYGNVRLDSKKARNNLDKAGLKVSNRFDALDTLETRADLEMLYDTLLSVKDVNGSHAVFTPFSVPCNINFERMAETGYKEYYYELLPETFSKLDSDQSSAYAGTWKLWNEGIARGIMVPQFHGREHFNLKLFEEKLEKKDQDLRVALENRSYTSITNGQYTTISSMAAFDFWEFKENERFTAIIEDGLNAFEKVFKYRSVHFNPPGGREHPVIHDALNRNGIKFIDTPLLKKEHTGSGRFRRIFNYTGKVNKQGQLFMVRNIVFEPTEERNIDWVSFTMKQIEAAFRWNRPAIISSHRVNFCGHIDEKNRENGLSSLGSLLKKIVKRWPEVEFMAANQLGNIILRDKQ